MRWYASRRKALRDNLDLPECPAKDASLSDNTCPSDCESPFAITADMLSKAGDYVMTLGRRTFLTFTVPTYMCVYELPSWVYNTGAPVAMDWVSKNVTDRISTYVRPHAESDELCDAIL